MKLVLALVRFAEGDLFEILELLSPYLEGQCLYICESLIRFQLNNIANSRSKSTKISCHYMFLQFFQIIFEHKLLKLSGIIFH